MFFIRIFSLLFLTAAGALAAASPPPSVTATPATCSSVTVTWVAAPGNGSSAPAQYEIFRDTTSTSIGTVAATVLTFTDSGAGSYSTHIYGVRTKISSGTYSSVTWSSSASTAAQCPPGAPGSLAAGTPSCSQVSLSWTAPTQTGSGLIGYRIYRNNVYITQVTGLSYSNTGLAASTSYTYDVSAMDSAGHESAKTRVVATTPSCQSQPPGMPGNLSSATPSCSQVSISWTAPTQPGAGLVGYKVYRNSAFVAQVTGLSYAESGLAGSTSYTYEVSAVDSANAESVKAGVVAITPSCQGPPPSAGPPGNASVAVQGLNGVINWPGSAGVRYQVECSADFGINWLPVDAPTTTFGVTHVRVGSSVVYRVAWFTNTAEYRNNYSLYSSDVTAPTAISAATATELAGSQVRIDWSASSDTQSGLKGYLLYRDNAFLAFTPNGVTSYTDTTGQGASSDYDVAALDRAGNVTAKVRPGCNYNLSSSSWAATACGGGTSVYVTASKSTCSWSASSPCGWLTVSPSGGTGSGWVTLSAASNTSGSSRNCYVTIAGQTFSVSQSTCACNYTISTSSSPAAGGSTSGGGTVSCGSSVTLSATANSGYTFANWTEGGSQVSSSASYNFAANANRTLVANFTATPCSYSLSPGSSSFGNSGGSGSFIAYTTSGCSRTATPSAGWITVTSGGSGSGNGTVYFSVAANTGAARSGTITISGSGPSQTYTVYQDAAATCTYSMTPNNVYFSSATAGGSSIVTAGGGCAWTATALDNWVTITGGGSGAGSGTVAYSVNSNPSLSVDRVARIRVVGGNTTNTLTINQDRNYAPVANAGANSSAVIGASVAMDGSGSTDDDGAIVSYSWNYGDGGTGSGVSASHAYVVPGNYTVTLTTTDDLGASSSASKLVTVSVATGTPGELQFVRTVSSPSGMHVYSKGTAGDHSGNSISVGYFTGSADFGGGTVNSSGSGDAFIAKYDSQGRLLWARVTSGPQDEVARAVAVDRADNILVTGYFYGTVDFGGASLTSVGSSDIFLAKYSPTGSLLWVKRFGGGASDSAYGVAVDGNDNAFLVGYFQGTGDFGGYSLTSSGGSIDIVLLKVNSIGTVAWAKRYGGGFSEYANGIAVDSAGDVAITGQIMGGNTTDLGGGSVTGSGIFVAKYTGSTGNYSWSRVLGGGTGGYSVACDPRSGNVIITGNFQGTLNFGGGPVISGSGGGLTIFLAGYSPNGSFLWVNTWGGLVSSTFDQGMAVRFSDSGALALTGTLTSPIDFGGGMLFGSGNSFVAAFTVVGDSVPVYRWAKRSGGPGAAYPYGCGFDSTGNVLTSGQFNSTVDFGGISVSAYGADNAFLCRYAY